MFELRVAVRMLRALHGLARRLEAVAKLAQQSGDGLVADAELNRSNISADSLCALLLVHRNGESGSPRVAGSTNSRKAGTSSG
jgi:hypothetical protein